MRNIGWWILGCFVGVLAVYGACRLLVDIRPASVVEPAPTHEATHINVSSLFKLWVAYMQWVPKNPVPADARLDQFTIFPTDDTGKAFAVLKLGDGQELCYCLQDAKATVSHQGKKIVFTVARDGPPPTLAQQ